MIASLRGVLRASGPDHVVVETGGIGYLVSVPRPLLATLGSAGDTVLLHTLLVVREDSLSLYGFETPAQRALFETLLSVSGVGPRVALNLLSHLAPDDLAIAVAGGDAVRLARVPGIGKKMAERLILELKSKLDLSKLPAAAGVAGGSAPPEVVRLNTELIDLLVGLGYSSSEASSAVAALPADAPLDLEARLRLVLRSFGSA